MAAPPAWDRKAEQWPAQSESRQSTQARRQTSPVPSQSGMKRSFGDLYSLGSAPPAKLQGRKTQRQKSAREPRICARPPPFVECVAWIANPFNISHTQRCDATSDQEKGYRVNLTRYPD